MLVFDYEQTGCEARADDASSDRAVGVGPCLRRMLQVARSLKRTPRRGTTRSSSCAFASSRRLVLNNHRISEFLALRNPISEVVSEGRGSRSRG